MSNLHQQNKKMYDERNINLNYTYVTKVIEITGSLLYRLGQQQDVGTDNDINAAKLMRCYFTF
jgi:hypothetical protein